MALDSLIVTAAPQPAAAPLDEAVRLRRGLRDLAAVSLLHGLWDGREVRDIADALCGTAYRLLDLDVAAVRVGGTDGFVVSYPAHHPDVDALLAEADAAVVSGATLGNGLVAHGQDLEGVPALVVGRATRAGFPSDVEALIFRAVANEASVAARASRRLQEARAARGMLEAVVQQLPIGVVVAEAPSGRIVARNAAFDRIIEPLLVDGDVAAGMGDEVTLAALARHLPATRPDGRPYGLEQWPLQRSLHGEIVTDEEVVLAVRSGSPLALSISSAPVRTASGEVVAAAATVADITARREADALRDGFISMLSHELRTPVTSIYAGAQLLRRPPGAGAPAVPRTEIAADIAIEAERLDRIMQNFLVIARVERGAEIQGHEPVLVQRLVPPMIRREQERWSDRAFSNELPPDLPPVAGDESSMELVVRNLLNNAAKYGGSGAHVLVRGSHDGEQVRIEVLDDGPGLSDAEAERIFSLFYRSPRLSKAAEGAGVGLYVVRSVVRAMGGTTWACERAEGGARIGFSLPIWADGDQLMARRGTHDDRPAPVLAGGNEPGVALT